jgi:hypothetical protein
MSNFRTFSTMVEIERTHNGHWFDRATMRFFSSRLPDPYSTPIGGRYFISSERNDTQPRLFTIREALSNGEIETVGEFQGFATRKAAEKAAAELPTTHSAYLMAVLESDGRGWIRTSKQLAKYTGAPLADCQATIRARANARRRAARKVAA